MLSVLFLGGTGVISSACVALAVERGLDVTALTRGHSDTRPLPEGARAVTADADDPVALRAALDGRHYDAVVDFVGFVPAQVEARLEALRDRTGHYVFISSASAYQKPPARLPVTESTPLRNPFLGYSRDKIACEDVLVARHRDEGLPATIIRPSHTYDRTAVPLDGGWTAIERMRQGRPVVVHGDGTSLWTLTHHRDVARALVPLLGDPRTHGEAYTVTGDDVLTWDQITLTLAAAAGVEAQLVHVASSAIARVDADWGAALLGDKAHCAVFDTAKLRALVPGHTTTIPFHLGAREIVEWHDADPGRRRVDARIDAAMDELVARFG